MRTAAERNCWTPKQYDGGAFNKRFCSRYSKSNHRSLAMRTTTYSITAALFGFSARDDSALCDITTLSLFDRLDNFANSVLRSFRMRAINWSWSSVCSAQDDGRRTEPAAAFSRIVPRVDAGVRPNPA
jgi:hypothetical protein